MNGLVLSDTAFDHSFNYQSVIGFSKAVEVTDVSEKMKVFCEFTDRYIPGRIADVGLPTEDQIRITRIAKLDLSEAAVKERHGDSGLKRMTDKWIGVLPLNVRYGAPIPDELIRGKVHLPEYIAKLIDP